MQDDSMNDALQVDVLAAALRANKAETGNLIEWLAERLQAILPGQTSVSRDGWPFGAKHVKEVIVRFEAVHFVLARQGHGMVTCQERKVVRDVVLKTSDVSMDKWIQDLAASLSTLAEQHSETRQALSDFLLGK